MRTAAPDVGVIDTELTAAALFLDVARRRHAHSPSAQNARALERAREDVDRLLDHRLLAAMG